MKTELSLFFFSADADVRPGDRYRLLFDSALCR
jgi:hypothetical protein